VLQFNRVTSVSVLLLAAALVLGACGSVDSTNNSSGGGSPMPKGALAKDKEILLGRSVYSSNCVSCHGVSGGGGRGPSFNDGRVLKSFPNATDQETLVRQGRSGMPAFGGDLTDAQITAVVRYEREVLAKL